MIGLFGLVGMFGVAMGPLVGKAIDRLVPWYASLFSLVFLTFFQAIQTGAGGINIAAVIVSTMGLDIFRQMVQVSLSTSVFGFVQCPSRQCLIIVWIDLLTVSLRLLVRDSTPFLSFPYVPFLIYSYSLNHISFGRFLSAKFLVHL